MLSSQSLAVKLIGPFVALYLMSLVLLAFTSTMLLNGALWSSLEEKARITVKNLAGTLAEPAAIGEYDKLRGMLEVARQSDQDVAYARLISTDGRGLASVGLEADIEGDRRALESVSLKRVKGANPETFEWILPVRHGDTTLGTLRVGFSTQRTRQVVLWISSIVVVTGVVALALGVAIYWWLTRHLIVHPLRYLVELFSQVARGEVGVERDLARGGKDEVGQLLGATHSMVAYLREMAEAADLIASGKLDIKIEPRSEADRFGNAFRKMLEAMTHELEALQEVIARVEASGRKMAEASSVLAGSARDQEAHISEQAAVTHEIVATTNQISATAHELSVTMDSVAANAEKTSGLASQGRGLLEQISQTMDYTTKASLDVADRLSVLNEKTARIGLVVTTITKVADQTNLLSLNASIEAEKAGEYGPGFRVVAGEIRRLADQTALATLDIERTVREVQSAVTSGVLGMNKFNEELRQGALAAQGVIEQLSEIIAQAQAMNQHFEDVNVGMKSQAEGARQISESIMQLSTATQNTATSIRTFNDVVASLREATQSLASVVVSHRQAEKEREQQR